MIDSPERKLAQQRLKDFERHPRFAGSLPLALLSAVPVVLTPDLVHLLRINFLPHLPYTAEADLLLSPLCSQVGDDLYEIERNIRDLLLDALTRAEGGGLLLREVATLLWNYSQAFTPWIAHTGLERAQELTALGVLDKAAADKWLQETAESAAKGSNFGVSREWFIAMQREQAHTDAATAPKVAPTIRVTTSSGLNLRALPSTDGVRLAQLQHGITAPILAATQDATGQQWLQIEANGTRGWVLSQYVEIIGDLSSIPTSQVTAKGQIYVSYPSEMRAQIREIRPVLESDGWKMWMDEDAPSSERGEARDREIRNSDAMLVAVNERAGASIYITYEWATALALGKPVIPMVFGGATPPPRLASLSAIDAQRQPYPALLQALNNATSRSVDRPTPQNHVYIAYDSDDLRFVGEMQSQLASAQIPVQMRDTAASPDRDARADAALRSAFAVIVVMSINSVQSVNATYEWATALALGIPVIPVRIGNVEIHPILARNPQIAFISDTSWSALFERVQQLQPQQQPSAAELVEQGLALYRQGQYNDAEALFERALQADPNHEDAAYWYASIRLRFGDADSAQRELERVVKLLPNSARIHAMLGRVYMQRGSNESLRANASEAKQFYAQAEEQLALALQVAPNLFNESGASWWETLGALYQRQDNLRSSIDAYQQAANYAQPTADATLALAELYAAAGQIADMRAMFGRLEPMLLEATAEQITDYTQLVDLVVAQACNGSIEGAFATLDRLTALLTTNNAQDTLIDNLLYSFRHWQTYFDENANRVLTEAARRLEGLKRSGGNVEEAQASNATFIADVTIPDGTQLQPGQRFAKTWRIRNTGHTAWGRNYTLDLIDGTDMRNLSMRSVPLLTAAPGEEVEITANLAAPSSPGVYRSTWRARDDNGNFFGDTFSVHIQVAAQAQATAPTLASRVYYFARYKLNTWQPVTVVLYPYRGEDDHEVDEQVTSLQAVARYAANAEYSDVRMTTAPVDGTTLVVTPSAPGIEFSPPSLTVAYHDGMEAFDFRFRVRQVTLAQEITEMRLEVSAGGATLMIHHVRLVPDVSEAQQVSEAPDTPGSASPYQSVFACYSREDAAIIERVSRSYEALGINFIADPDLRSGDNWQAGIERAIASADIFQLFWSQSAAASPFVEREWRYALKLLEDGSKPANFNFIRPVYWEQPMPPPPPELRHLHFQYNPDLAEPPVPPPTLDPAPG